MQRAQCERDIITESAQIARRRRARTPISRSSACARSCSAADHSRRPQVAHPAVRRAGARRPERAALDSSQLAGMARTSINVMALDLQRGDVTIGEQPPTEHAGSPHSDARVSRALATMSLRHRCSTSPAPASRSSSAWRRRSPPTTCSASSSGRATARATATASTSRSGGATSPSARVRRSCCRRPRKRASRSPRTACATRCRRRSRCPGLPLRVTTFAHQDPGQPQGAPDGRRRRSAQPGATPRATSPSATSLIADDNHIAGSFADKRDAVAGSARVRTSRCDFVSGVTRRPGHLLAALRCRGRAKAGAGSVVREVNAWKMAGEALAIGDLIVGNLPASGQGLRAGSSRTSSTIGSRAYLELYSNAAGHVDKRGGDV